MSCHICCIKALTSSMCSVQCSSISLEKRKCFEMALAVYDGKKNADTYKYKSIQTCEVICGPGAQFTGSAGVLIKHKLVFFTGSARPAAAHLTFTNHLLGAHESQCALIPMATVDVSRYLSRRELLCISLTIFIGSLIYAAYNEKNVPSEVMYRK